MTTTWVGVRGNICTTLETLGVAEVYRYRASNFVFPAFVVALPSEIDPRATMGGARDYTINVDVIVEVRDEESADAELHDLTEQAMTALLAAPDVGDVRPINDFGEELTADNRLVIFARLPVVVYG